MKEIRFFVYTRSGRRPLRQKVATIQVAALPCTPFLFRLRRVPFGFTKETFPTALEGLLVDPNILEVSVTTTRAVTKNMSTLPVSLFFW